MDKRILILNASERFSNIKFPPPTDRFDPDAEPLFDSSQWVKIYYQCARCEYKINFKESDFFKHFNSSYSNLSEADSKLIGEHLSKDLSKGHNFSCLDFYCPKCKLPVRVYYNAYPGSKGGIDYIIEKVIEIHDVN